MHKSIHNLALINDQIKSKFTIANDLQIIAVSKTYPMSEINPLIENGHIHFGENKVQEAVDKWTTIKKSHEHLKLHMIGKLQTNKVKYVVPLFDYIHSLDNIRLAEKIASEQIKKNRNLKIFIQVNIGDEPQKAGLNISDLQNFYKKCTQELKLNIIGLMCLPPQYGLVKTYFNKMSVLNKIINLNDLSMGMSEDYLDAIDCGATYIRIGSKIFGKRS
ncbi:YggS family pyridoxal phosphate-dependent enzyme [Candidatus Pelagibacter sp.]|nr:YggS family pyridoxal phosphate-dependent enzyme [Candidatus Pelagibacter sp.]MDA9890427.1 YggS family pyridoxal phosphate-dependent enzyme [Candidatus Pelagibacter sp.]